jgi:hypothetical protein
MGPPLPHPPIAIIKEDDSRRTDPFKRHEPGSALAGFDPCLCEQMPEDY